MAAQYGNIIFVMWRECIEALLVIGVLNAWLGVRPVPERRAGRLALWSGVVAGLIGACALAALLLWGGEMLGDEGQDYFQATILFVAAGLILQMVLWMRRNGRTLKQDMHASLDAAANKAQWVGVFTLAALAVLREGSEAAIFLYGTAVAASTSTPTALSAGALGLAAAGLTYAALQAGGRLLSWRIFFRGTEIMLLVLAGALLVSGVDRLISLGIIPAMSSTLWDTSRLLPDSGAIGGLISGFTGYRAKPVLVEVLTMVLFWGLVWWLVATPRTRIARAA